MKYENFKILNQSDCYPMMYKFLGDTNPRQLHSAEELSIDDDFPYKGMDSISQLSGYYHGYVQDHKPQTIIFETWKFDELNRSVKFTFHLSTEANGHINEAVFSYKKDKDSYTQSFNFDLDGMATSFYSKKNSDVNSINEEPAVINYYDANQNYKCFFYKNDFIHRDTGPAVVVINKDKVIEEQYLIDGELFGKDLKLYTKEAITTFYQNYMLLK